MEVKTERTVMVVVWYGLSSVYVELLKVKLTHSEFCRILTVVDEPSATGQPTRPT